MVVLYERYNGTATSTVSIGNTHQWIEQTFTIGATGPNATFNIYSAKFKLQKVGNPNTSLYAVIRAVDASTGVPSGPELVSSTVLINSFGGTAIVEFVFSPTNVYLTAGVTYALMIHQTATTNLSNYVNVLYNSSDVYSGGKWVLWEDDILIATPQNWDNYFEVWGAVADITYAIGAPLALTSSQKADTPTDVNLPSAQSLSLTRNSASFFVTDILGSSLSLVQQAITLTIDNHRTVGVETLSLSMTQQDPALLATFGKDVTISLQELSLSSQSPGFLNTNLPDTFSENLTQEIQVPEVLKFASLYETISNFDGGAGIEWKELYGVSPIADDTTYFNHGSKSIKMPIDQNLEQEIFITKKINLDMTSYAGAVFRFYISNIQTFGEVNIYFGCESDASWINYFLWNGEKAGGTVANPYGQDMQTGWNDLFANKDDFRSQNSPDWANIKKIGISISPTPGAQVDVYCDQLALTRTLSKGVVILTDDDGCKTNITIMRPKLNYHGFKCTFFIIGNVIGQADKMTLADIQTLIADGHDLSSHTWSHPDLRNLTHAQRITEFNTMDAFMKTNNFNHPELLAYPGGAWNWDVVQDAMNYYSFGRAFRYYSTWSNPIPINPMWTPAMAWGEPSLEDTKIWADKIESEKNVGMIYFHDITDDGLPDGRIGANEFWNEDHGTGYSSGETYSISGGNGDATLQVDSIGENGSVESYHIVNSGTGYSEGMGTAVGGDNNFNILIVSIENHHHPDINDFNDFIDYLATKDIEVLSLSQYIAKYQTNLELGITDLGLKMKNISMTRESIPQTESLNSTLSLLSPEILSNVIRNRRKMIYINRPSASKSELTRRA